MTLSRPRSARRIVAVAAVAAIATTGVAGLNPAYAAPTAVPAANGGNDRTIAHDATAKQLTLTDGDLRMVVDYAGGALVSSFTQGGTELLSDGIYSSAEIDGSGATLDSRTLPADPTVKVHGKSVDLTFEMSNAELTVDETWTFQLDKGAIDLDVDRRYDWADGVTPALAHNGQLEIGWARVWDNIRRPGDGGNIPIGNAYTGKDGFYLNEPNDRYGVEQSSFVMLANDGERALAVEATSDRDLATEFAYGEGNTYQETQVRDGGEWEYIVGTKEQGFVYSGHSSNGTDRYIYLPVDSADDRRDTVAFSFASADYDAFYDLGGTINGVADTAALSSLLNDFGRSGVVDEEYGMSTVGLRYLGNGPYDLAHSNPTVMGYFDPAMTESQKGVLEYFRDYAQGENGHMYGRTYRLTNEWGDNNLHDADPAYAAAIAEMYDYSPDEEWLASMRDSAHRAMDYMLDQRYDAPTGMFTNGITDCNSRRGIMEWNDAFYVKWQSGYVNELMYHALTKWATLEKDVFGDETRATLYADTAAQLREQFNKDAADGGLWDPEMGAFAYWRCPDGTVQASVKHTQLNLQAIAFGMVDIDRARAILDDLDVEMKKNRLPMIPQNFYPILPNTEEWSGDHFQSGLEDGPIYPFMTELYMKPAAFVGERDRSLEYLDNTLERYTRDGFVGWSFLDWSLEPRFGEEWFPTNANAGGGVYTAMLGIRPTPEGVEIAPNFPAEMNGTSVTRTIHEDDELTVTYHSVLDQTVQYRTDDKAQAVTLEWSGQEPGSEYTVREGKREQRVTADAAGVVRYELAGTGKETRVTLIDGSVDGYVLETDVPENLAVGAPTEVSSSWEEDRFLQPGVTDGSRFSTDPSMGWSSDSELSVDHTEWVTVDLGEVAQVGRVDLLPRNYDGRDIGRGFPVDFTIETSVDGETWEPAAAESSFAQPTGFDVPTWSFDSRDARFVRVTGTSLRQTDGGYRMQLAEIEIFAG
jgi:F5/8 type C domain